MNKRTKILASAAMFGLVFAVAIVHADSTGLSLLARADTGAGGDLAFWGTRAYLAHGPDDEDPHNDGFRIVDIADPRAPEIIGSFTCVESGHDIGVWENLVFLSVNAMVRGTACDADVTDPTDPLAWSGLRVVSVADPTHPRQVAAVGPSNGGVGSHTHTIWPDLEHRDAAGRPAPRLLVFLNGASPEGIVEVPLDDPSRAAMINEFNTPPNRMCHDVSFFRARRLASCNGVQPDTQLWDMSDPVHPRVISHIVNPLIEHHHGSAFSVDGNTLIIAEESLSNFAPELCYAGTPLPKGMLWFYDITDASNPRLLSHYQLPEAGGAGYCSSHQLNVIPTEDRDVLVAAWYGAGTTAVDFTDRARPTEIASFVDTGSFPWASYWYNGAIYVNNMRGVLGPVEHGSARGLDVLALDEPVAGVQPQSSFNFGTQ